MFAIRDVNQTPVGGWSWIDPLTRFPYNLQYGVGKAGLDALLEHVRRYRADNMLPALDVKDTRRKIEHDICNRPGMYGRCVDVSQAKRSIGQMASGAMAAAKTLVANFIPGEHENAMVGKRLAEKRAAICENCPANQPPTDQGLIELMQDAAMVKLIGSRQVSIQDKLFSCAACSCVIRAKIWFARRVITGALDAPTKAKLAAANGLCWQLKEAT